MSTNFRTVLPMSQAILFVNCALLNRLCRFCSNVGGDHSAIVVFRKHILPELELDTPSPSFPHVPTLDSQMPFSHPSDSSEMSEDTYGADTSDVAEDGATRSVRPHMQVIGSISHEGVELSIAVLINAWDVLQRFLWRQSQSFGGINLGQTNPHDNHLRNKRKRAHSDVAVSPDTLSFDNQPILVSAEHSVHEQRATTLSSSSSSLFSFESSFFTPNTSSSASSSSMYSSPLSSFSSSSGDSLMSDASYLLQSQCILLQEDMLSFSEMQRVQDMLHASQQQIPTEMPHSQQEPQPQEQRPQVGMPKPSPPRGRSIRTLNKAQYIESSVSLL